MRNGKSRPDTPHAERLDAQGANATRRFSLISLPSLVKPACSTEKDTPPILLIVIEGPYRQCYTSLSNDDFGVHAIAEDEDQLWSGSRRKIAIIGRQ